MNSRLISVPKPLFFCALPPFMINTSSPVRSRTDRSSLCVVTCLWRLRTHDPCTRNYSCQINADAERKHGRHVRRTEFWRPACTGIKSEKRRLMYVPLAPWWLMDSSRPEPIGHFGCLMHLGNLALPARSLGQQWQTRKAEDVSIWHPVYDKRCVWWLFERVRKQMLKDHKTHLAPKHQPSSFPLICLAILTSRSIGIS